MAKDVKICLFFLVLFFFFAALPSASAEVGVTDDEILIGTIQAMTGGMAYVGNQNVLGTKAMVEEINKKGGINGRKERSDRLLWMTPIVRTGMWPMFGE